MTPMLLNAIRMMNVVLMSAGSAAAAISFEHGYVLVGAFNAIAAGLIMVGLILRLALTSEYE